MTLLAIHLTDDEARELRRVAKVSLPPSDDLRTTAHYDERATYSVLKKVIRELDVVAPNQERRP